MDDNNQQAKQKGLFSIGLTPDTSAKEAETHRFLILMGMLMACGGLLWGTISIMHNLLFPSMIPYGYAVFTAFNFFLFYKTKNFAITRFFQVFISLCLPFLFQWLLGGFVSSGSIMIWAMLALTGAMTFEQLNSSIKWLIAYILLVILSSIADGYFRENFYLNMSQSINTMFFGINIGVVSLVVFGLMFFFKSRLESRELQLMETHHELQASEEELRQNTEELKTINDSLEEAQQELKLALSYEQESKEELTELNERLNATYQELVSSEQALQENIDSLKEINQQLEKTQKDLQHALEEEQESKRKLELANRELRETQMQLVQIEKMASLGEMTAGIAHEINNPLNFISGGVQSLQMTMTELFVILSQYHELENTKDEAEREQVLTQLKQVKDEYAYEELLDDVKDLLMDISSGSNRATEVVRNLQQFSRQDLDEVVMANIHEGIDSSLVILKNKTSPSIEITRDYDANIQQFECYAGQLNQVFMNLISNAIDALEGKGEIKIITQNFDKSIKVIIQDNGTGIPEDIKNKIFDPFFTTKDVGSGTGLGLSICHGIIKKHEGTIQLESKQGEGTSFIIELPKNLSSLKKERATL